MLAQHLSGPPRLCLALLLLMAAGPCRAIYKCEAGGALTYTDQPCGEQQAQAFKPAPLPTLPALKPAPQPRPPDAASRGPSRAARQSSPMATAQAAKCGQLQLRLRWAQEDLRQAQSLPLRPQDKRLENAQRKARRAGEQYRLACPAPS